ncbi:MAG TPA: hypothetical protein VKA34_16705 [Balneolales bacterium]|nr:hypothetical protein [Balneolales bacterium]
MPELSEKVIRISLIYLVIGFTLGAILLINKATNVDPQIWILLPIHIEIVIFGWLIQLIMGVAYWSFPRFFEMPNRGNPHYNWLMIIILNVGIWTSISGDLFLSAKFLPMVGRCLETIGIIGFFMLIWQRTRSPQRHHQ